MAFKPSICTMSLGRCYAGHSLPHKLDMARKYGFKGIEVFYEDIVSLAKDMAGGDTLMNQLAAAATVRKLCDERDLEVIALQPFLHYEGLLNRMRYEKRLKDVCLFMAAARALGTDLILLPSNYLPEGQVTDDIDIMVADMTMLADFGLGRNPVVRFAYEALCWGTRINTWEQSWEVVRRVDRPNFGICLDTFNIAGRVFADPACISGKTPNAAEAMRSCLENMSSTIDPSKIFLVQVADAERLSQPLDSLHPFFDSDQPPRMSWSRNARLFYGESEQGAYLPIKGILDVIVNKLGFQGWLSFEVFHRRLAEEDEEVPEEMARRAAEAWGKLVDDLGLDIEGNENKDGPAQGDLRAIL